MFIIAKLVDYLFLPPGIFFILLALSYLFFHLKRTKVLRVFLIASAALIYFCSIEPVKDALLLPLENRYPPLKPGVPADVDTGPGSAAEVEAEYICVLGGGIYPNSPEAGGKGTLSRGALKRVVYAFGIARESALPVISAGGIVFKDAGLVTEAEVMNRTLIDLGVEKGRLLTEERSRNTWENASFVSERFRPDRVILVTSAFHMPRSVYSFEKQGIQVVPAPTDYLTGRGGYTLRSFLPAMGSFQGVHTALKEYLGLVYYTVRYR